MTSLEKKRKSANLQYYYIIILILVTIIMSVFIYYEVKTVDKHVEQLAMTEAKSNFDKDVSFRNWIATHGGAYVPTSDMTPPNPNLSHISERDIITPSGKKLTLMNPAYMMRQLNEYFYQSYGKYGHITSLKLLRAANKPDEWEREALLNFENGTESVMEFTKVYGVPYIRYMEPLITKEGCLRCHAHQGYKVGDIRGGIGVKIPIAKYWRIGIQSRDKIIFTYLMIWGIIIILVTIGYIKLKYYISELENAEDEAKVVSKELKSLNENLTSLVEERTKSLDSALEESQKSLSEKNKIFDLLSASEYNYRSIIENMVGVFIRIDFDYNFILTSASAIKLFEAESKAELFKINFLNNIVFDTENWFVFLDKLKSNHRVQGCELEIKTLNGNKKYILLNFSLYYDKNNKIAGYEGVITDITERKIALIQLEIYKDTYKIIERSPVVVFLWENEKDWPVEFVSQNVEKIYGYTADDFWTGEIPYSSIIHPDDLERVSEEVNNNVGINATSFTHKTYRIITKSGEIRWIKDETILRKNEKGDITHFEGIIIDITEQEKTLLELKKLDIAIDNSINEVYIFNENNLKFSFANNTAVKNIGYSISELLNMTPLDLKPEYKEETFRKLLSPLLKNKIDKFKIETVHKRKDSSTYPVEINISKFLIDNKAHFVALIEDVTERKEKERIIEKQNEKLNSIMNAYQDGIYLSSIDYEIQFLNPVMEKIIGHNAIGEKCYKAIFNSDTPCEWCYFKQENNNDNICNQIEKDNKFYDVSSHILENNLLFITYHDITQRRKNELHLKQLEMAVEQSANTIVLTDIKGMIEYVNPKFVQLTEYTKEEAIGQNPSVLKSGEQGKEFYKDLWDTIKKGNIWSGVFHNKSKSGRLFWEKAIISPIFNSKGDIINFLAIKEDITKQKFAEDVLKDSEARHRALFEATTDAIVILEPPKWTVQSGNQAAYKLFGMKNDTYSSGIKPILLSAPIQAGGISAQKKSVEHIKTALKEGSVYFDWLHKKANGDIFPTQVSFSKVEIGEKTVIQAIIRDVTNQKKIEAELVQKEKQQRALLESSRDAILTLLPPNWTIGTINPAGSELFNIVLDDNNSIPVDLSPATLSPEQQPDGKSSALEAKNHIENALANGSEFFEWEHSKMTGETFATTVLLSKVELDDTVMIMANVRDITKAKELEVQLLQSQKLESIGQLAAGIAHEINSPLQFIGDNVYFLEDAYKDILGFYSKICKNFEESVLNNKTENILELYKEQKEEMDIDFLQEEIPEAFERANLGIKRVSKIVGAMRNFSHKSKDEHALADINKGIEDTVIISKNEWKYLVNLTTNLDKDIQLIPCLLDELNQVFLIMIVNATHAIKEKFGDVGNKPGEIEIASKCNNTSVTVTISDNGGGIPEAIITKIYDPFFTTKKIGMGTGQGLSIARDIIVNKHNGTLNVETVQGEGTKFIIELPLKIAEDNNNC